MMRKKVVIEFFVDVDSQGMIDDVRDGHEGEKVCVPSDEHIVRYVRHVLNSSYDVYHLLEPTPYDEAKISVEGGE
jgi:hypothetical protein